MQGELVTETLAFDGGREVTAFVPAAPPAAVVFAGDGPAVAAWGALVADDGLPTMVVAAHGLADEGARLHEYSPGFDPERFAAHERFVVDDVRAWVRTRFGVDLPANRTAVLGMSAGGELALALGLRHPNVFGTVLCGSPGGGFQPPADLGGRLPRAYLFGGTEEPWFLENATRWADALSAAGADVVLRERPGDHGPDLWRAEVPAMVAWAFGPGAA